MPIGEPDNVGNTITISNVPGGAPVTPATPAPFLTGVQDAIPPQGRVAPEQYPNGAARFFTAEDVERIRKEEKDKLYPQLKEAQDRASRFEQAEAERSSAAQIEAERVAEEARIHATEEMSAKELLERERSERLAAEQRFAEELARRDAISAMEQRFQSMERYKVEVVAANADQILPELRDLVAGDTEETINASVQGLIQRTAAILGQIRSVDDETIRAQPGVSPFSPAMGPESFAAGQRTFSAQDIANWSMEDYRRYRSQLAPGRAESGSDGGMFR